MILVYDMLTVNYETGVVIMEIIGKNSCGDIILGQVEQYPVS